MAETNNRTDYVTLEKRGEGTARTFNGRGRERERGREEI